MSQEQLRLKREKNSRKYAGAERWHLLEQYAIFLEIETEDLLGKLGA